MINPPQNLPARPPIRRRGTRGRRGVAVLVVLSLVAITLSLSYAMMRSQATAVQIQNNSGRRGNARQAAQTGLTIALRKMSEANWAITSAVTGQLSSSESFSATYAVGDSSLTPTSALYGEFPYRVTVTSTGVAFDPSQPTVKATHQMQAVVRLVPRKLPSSPSDLATFLNYTIFQTDDEDFNVEVPTRIEGAVRIQGPLELSEDYKWGSSTRQRFLFDLNQIRVSGSGDYRPFNGPLALDYTETSSSARSELTSYLGLTIFSAPKAAPSSAWTYPGPILTYRLYTGGTVYSAQTLGSSLTSVQLKPDPATNPLGLFYAPNTLTINDNVSIQGTLICRNVVEIRGANFSLQPQNLLGLNGASTPVQLPSLIGDQDVRIHSTCSGSISGLVALWSKLQVYRRPQGSGLSFIGRVILPELDIAGRDEWDFGKSTWDILYSWYHSQLDNQSRILYFPYYIAIFGLNSVSQVTFRREESTVTYHWHTASNPVFVPLASDVGLRWEVLRWVDLP